METQINTPVRFSVSEPEDFYFDNGEGPFDGMIVGFDSGVMYVEVRSEIQHHNKKLRYLAVVARHEGESLCDLGTNPYLIVNLVPLPVDKYANSVSPEELADLSKRFRGQHLFGEVWIAA